MQLCIHFFAVSLVYVVYTVASTSICSLQISPTFHSVVYKIARDIAMCALIVYCMVMNYALELHIL